LKHLEEGGRKKALTKSKRRKIDLSLLGRNGIFTDCLEKGGGVLKHGETLRKHATGAGKNNNPALLNSVE